MADVLERTKESLAELLNRLRNRKVIITSDHGYIYGASPNHYEEVRGVERLPRERRAFKENEVTESLMREGSVISHEGWVVFKERYWRGGTGQNTRHTAHGGSFFARGFSSHFNPKADLKFSQGWLSLPLVSRATLFPYFSSLAVGR